MTAVDYILIAVIILSVIFGAIRGFLRESIALLAWLVGLWIAWKYSGLLEPHLGGALAGTALQTWAARGILLLAVVIAGWLLAGLLYDVRPRDPLVFALVPVTILLVSTAAWLGPARRAAHASPLDALRGAS